MNNSPTLRIKFPIGMSVFSAAIILVWVMVVVESFSRSSWVESQNYYASYGISNLQFELKIKNLESLIQQGKQINCIFIGSSLVLRGLDPEMISEEAGNISGKSVSCYNFGINGLYVSGAQQLAEYLIDAYHPDILIYGLSPRALSHDYTDDRKQIFSSEWFKYASGEWTLNGWMVHHARSVQYLQTVFMEFYTPELEVEVERANHNMNVWGYAPIKMGFDEDLLERGVDNLKTYYMGDQQLVAYQNILNLDNNSTRLVLVEMPVSTYYIDYLKEGKVEYREVVDQLAGIAGKSQVIFLRTNSPTFLPDAYFRDVHHLNLQGAEMFSKWLGNLIGIIIK